MGEIRRRLATCVIRLLILGQFSRRLWVHGAEDADGDAAALEHYLRTPPFQKGRVVSGSDDVVTLSDAEHEQDAINRAVQHLPSEARGSIPF